MCELMLKDGGATQHGLQRRRTKADRVGACGRKLGGSTDLKLQPRPTIAAVFCT